MKKKFSWRYFVYHAILIALSLFFSLPFLWMLSTSFKADDEIIHDPMIWIPEFPERVTYSPYLDPEAHPPHWEKPTVLGKARWEGLQEDLKEAIGQKAKTMFESSQWPQSKNPMEPSLFVRALSDVSDHLWEAVHPRIPPSIWEAENPIPEVLDRISLEDVRRAWRRFYRALEIGGIHLRNESSIDIGSATGPADPRIPYQIDGRERILLGEREVALASPEETLDQVMVRVKGDASFHRLSAELDWRGKSFRTEEPMFLASGNYQDVFWKFAEQAKYDIEHLTFVERNGSPEGWVQEDVARMRFFLEPTPYLRVLWERFSDSYREVFFWVPYATYMWVTVKLTFLNILGQLFACSLVAFAFAKIKFPGRELLFILMLSTMMLPPQVTMVPQFVLFSKMGAYNTLFPLYILSFAGAPFFIFLMRQFYKTIPQDLTDAAKIDGCNFFQI
ncbi:MAG: ABC transporter permease subunit, partial [Candidatus Omnitrophica bacterium]|nr:ABC transporter permease subunit [Candidatus Omnitrophota bacterium]